MQKQQHAKMLRFPPTKQTDEHQRDACGEWYDPDGDACPLAVLELFCPPPLELFCPPPTAEAHGNRASQVHLHGWTNVPTLECLPWKPGLESRFAPFTNPALECRRRSFRLAPATGNVPHHLFLPSKDS